MMRARNAALLLFCLFLAGPAVAQPRGRVQGKILDDQGKPAAGVEVHATRTGEPAPTVAKTNEKGEWQMQLAVGDWNLEFVRPGFDPQRMAVKVADGRNPPIEMKLTKAVDPNVELQEQMKKAMELQQGGKVADALKIVEDLLVKYPSAVRLNAFLAQLYESEKNYDK